MTEKFQPTPAIGIIGNDPTVAEMSLISADSVTDEQGMQNLPQANPFVLHTKLPESLIRKTEAVTIKKPYGKGQTIKTSLST